MAKSKKSLAETHPELAKEWHPTKNGNLNPTQLSYGSGKKVWWKCEKGHDHEWEATLNSRSRGLSTCPVCSGRKAVTSNCLETTHPYLAQEWSGLNSSITPKEFTQHSTKKVFWECKNGDDHIWKASIRKRAMENRGCPYCAGQKVSVTNSLATKYPEIAKLWHPSKNGSLSPKDVLPKSAKKVWWHCEKGDDHDHQIPISSKTRGVSCPVCYGRKTVKSNSFGTRFPQLSKEWCEEKNQGLSIYAIAPFSDKKVWWNCPNDIEHKYRTSVKNRSLGTGCPICNGKQVDASNSLGDNFPNLISEWHTEKNKGLSPYSISYGSGQVVWWKCEKGIDHEWKSEVANRTGGRGCPFCAGQKVSVTNSLEQNYPELVKEWHIEFNGEIRPSNITWGTSKKVWWQCKSNNEHVWKASVVSRTRLNTNCPYCDLTPQSKQELTITFELKTLFQRIDPRGLKTKIDGRLRAIDIFIPQLNLCIEFDGAYWHKSKREMDKIKSNLLLKEGYSVIRVREEPLKKIHDTDVISKKPYDGKQVTNDILSMILSIYELDSELIDRIKEYQSKGELLNEKGLNRYIDKILKEKAEKK